MIIAKIVSGGMNDNLPPAIIVLAKNSKSILFSVFTPLRWSTACTIKKIPEFRSEQASARLNELERTIVHKNRRQVTDLITLYSASYAA